MTIFAFTARKQYMNARCAVVGGSLRSVRGLERALRRAPLFIQRLFLLPHPWKLFPQTRVRWLFEEATIPAAAHISCTSLPLKSRMRTSG